MATTKYDYETPLRIENAAEADTAIEYSVINYMRYQLGWSESSCRERIRQELSRENSKRLLDELVSAGWNIEGAKILDVGCGQGATVLELLNRGADAYGIEPGPEFLKVARMRLSSNCQDLHRVTEGSGEAIPFHEGSFDYVVCLQVLEHVADPEVVIREIFRVLKPGGQCYISCENYLSFREQHYRVPWLPLLPKSTGGMYLRIIGRDPRFLQQYVHYTTYPQIWRLCRVTGFENYTYEGYVTKVRSPQQIRRSPVRWLIRMSNLFSDTAAPKVVTWLCHILNFWRVGVSVNLRKPSEH